MRFDPQSFLSSRGIEFKIARNNAVFRCPWCGSSDVDGDNMGINLTNGKWGCWRSPSHRGPKEGLSRLLRALTGWNQAQADEFLQASGDSPNGTVGALRVRWTRLGASSQRQPPPAPVARPSEFGTIGRTGVAGRFWRYLVARKFREQDIKKLLKQYKLRCALGGQYDNRLILPLFEDGKLMGWTGRAIGQAKLRYDTYPAGAGTKRWLFNQDGASEGGDILVLVEGPLDALKLDFYAQSFGIRAVACLGTTLAPGQLSVLLKLAKKFKHVVILLDKGAVTQSSRFAARVRVLRPRIVSLTEGKDAGALDRSQIRKLARRIIKIVA